MVRINNHPVEHLQSIPFDFGLQCRRRSGQPRFADEPLVCASVCLNVDRRDVAEEAAVLVRLADLDNLDINRQPFDFRDCLAH